MSLIVVADNSYFSGSDAPQEEQIPLRVPEDPCVGLLPYLYLAYNPLVYGLDNQFMLDGYWCKIAHLRRSIVLIIDTGTKHGSVAVTLPRVLELAQMRLDLAIPHLGISDAGVYQKNGITNVLFVGGGGTMIDLFTLIRGGRYDAEWDPLAKKLGV